MTFKELFHLDNFFHKIKLDHSEKISSVEQEKDINYEKKRDDDKFYPNEWNQEYELIYLSYILEK